MSAIIQIDQDQAGPSLGTPGIARDDLWQGRVVTLTAGLSGTYLWEMLDKPPGSSSILNATTTQVIQFTPDFPGSYRIRLSVDGGVGTGRVQTKIAAVTKDFSGVQVNRGWRIPAYNENKDNPDEDNFNHGFGPNVRGWNQSYEFIFSDISANLTGGGLPPIGANQPGDVVGVVGVTGGKALFGPRMVIGDGTRVIVPDGGNTINLGGSSSPACSIHVSRLDLTGDNLLDTTVVPFPIGQDVFYDVVSSGLRLWIFGLDKTGPGFIQELISGVSVTFGTKFNLTADPIISADFDNISLWAISSAGDIAQISPLSPGIPVNTFSFAVSVAIMRIDPNGSNYGDFNPRGFFLDITNNLIQRFDFSIAPDASFALASGAQGLAVGSALSNGILFYVVGTLVGKINVDLVTGNATHNLNAVFSGLHSVDFDPIANRLWVTGETSGGDLAVATVIPSTLVIENSVVLTNDGKDSGYATYGNPSVRVRIIGTNAFICDPRLNDVSTLGDLYRISTTGPFIPARLPTPGPKTIGFINQNWQSYVPAFQSLNGDATLGDGTLLGFYRMVGHDVDVRFYFTLGTTTDFGTGEFIIDLPPGMMSDNSKINFIVDAVILANTNVFGYPVPLVAASGILLSGISPSLVLPSPGDFAVLHFTCPVI